MVPGGGMERIIRVSGSGAPKSGDFCYSFFKKITHFVVRLAVIVRGFNDC